MRHYCQLSSMIFLCPLLALLNALPVTPSTLLSCPDFADQFEGPPVRNASWATSLLLKFPGLDKGGPSSRTVAVFLEKLSTHHPRIAQPRLGRTLDTLSLPLNRLYFVAVCLHNSEHLLGNMLLQLSLLSLVLPRGSLFISVYDSASYDNTRCWFKTMKIVFRALGIKNNVVTSASVVRMLYAGRIQFLSAVRNAALNPLYSMLSQNPRIVGNLVFISDVYFTYEDVARLLHHQVDIACALDFTQRGRNETVFYDIWATRDINGELSENAFPYIKDTASLELLKNGTPFHVQACWNGVVAFDVKGFSAGLRFRAALPTECSAAETSLICDDFIRLGFQNIIVEPAVRVAYDYDVYNRIYSMSDVPVPVAGLGEAHQTLIKNTNSALATARVNSTCVSISPSICPSDNFVCVQHTEWATPKRYNLLFPNHTAEFFNRWDSVHRKHYGRS